MQKTWIQGSKAVLALATELHNHNTEEKRYAGLVVHIEDYLKRHNEGAMILDQLVAGCRGDLIFERHDSLDKLFDAMGPKHRVAFDVQGHYIMTKTQEAITLISSAPTAATQLLVRGDHPFPFSFIYKSQDPENIVDILQQCLPKGTRTVIIQRRPMSAPIAYSITISHLVRDVLDYKEVYDRIVSMPALIPFAGSLEPIEFTFVGGEGRHRLMLMARVPMTGPKVPPLLTITESYHISDIAESLIEPRE